MNIDGAMGVIREQGEYMDVMQLSEDENIIMKEVNENETKEN